MEALVLDLNKRYSKKNLAGLKNPRGLFFSR